MNRKLITAVEEQLGMEGDELRSTFQDVANHGADADYPGFTYYHDTCEFYKVNQKIIVAEVEAMAQDLGEEPTFMVQYFNCLSTNEKGKRKSDYTTAEVALTLYGTPKQHNDMVANALAWFALEEVARSIVDR